MAQRLRLAAAVTAVAFSATTFAGAAHATPDTAPVKPAQNQRTNVPSAHEVSTAKLSPKATKSMRATLHSNLARTSRNLNSAQANAQLAWDALSAAQQDAVRRSEQASEAKRQLSAAQSEEKKAGKAVGHIASETYRNGGMNVGVEQLLSDKNPQELLTRSDMLRHVSDSRVRDLEQARNATELAEQWNKYSKATQGAAEKAAGEQTAAEKKAQREAGKTRVTVLKESASQKQLLQRLASLNDTSVSDERKAFEKREEEKTKREFEAAKKQEAEERARKQVEAAQQEQETREKQQNTDTVEGVARPANVTKPQQPETNDAEAQTADGSAGTGPSDEELAEQQRKTEEKAAKKEKEAQAKREAQEQKEAEKKAADKKAAAKRKAAQEAQQQEKTTQESQEAAEERQPVETKATQQAEATETTQKKAADKKAAQQRAAQQAEAQKAAQKRAQKAAEKKAAQQRAEQKAAEKKAAQQRAAQQAEAQKAAQKRAQKAAEKKAAQQRAAQKAAEKRAAQQRAAQQAAAQKAAEKKAAQQRAAQQAAAQKAAEKKAAEKKAAQQAAAKNASAGTGKGAAISWAMNIANSPGYGYVFGANGPTNYDCSSFVQHAFAKSGVSTQRVADAQFTGAPKHVSVSQLQKGDLVFSSNNGSPSGIYHVAIYIGDGQVVHARNPQAGITVTPMSYVNNMYPLAARY